MLNDGFKPDAYSFNALFSAMADAGASLYAVQDLISEMAKWDIKVSCDRRHLYLLADESA
jgi:hypothetical protein